MSDPQGLAFDRLASDYDRGRPGWPESMLDGIEATSVLDLAAGTGKLTELLLARYAHVTAVEPLAGMRALLERNAPHARVLDGSAEQIPLEDATVDAVFVAEAFHWFDSAAAVREIARVLRPGGALLVCFNEWRSGFEPPLTEGARAVLAALWEGLPPPGGPKVQTGEWIRGFDGAPLAPLEERFDEHVWSLDRGALVAFHLSVSSIGAVPLERREEARAQLVAALPDVPYRLELAAHSFRTRRA